MTFYVNYTTININRNGCQFTFSEQFLKTLKLMSLNIWVVLKLKFPRNRDTVSGSFTEISNSLTRDHFEVALDVLTYQCQ